MAEFLPIRDYRITEHARSEVDRRGISEMEIASVLFAPGQVEAAREGRVVLQSLVTFGESEREYLLRVFVDIDCSPPAVVTAYGTSKIDRYWRKDESNL
jgi:hypothetical protein